MPTRVRGPSLGSRRSRRSGRAGHRCPRRSWRKGPHGRSRWESDARRVRSRKGMPPRYLLVDARHDALQAVTAPSPLCLAEALAAGAGEGECFEDGPARDEILAPTDIDPSAGNGRAPDGRAGHADARRIGGKGLSCVSVGRDAADGGRIPGDSARQRTRAYAPASGSAWGSAVRTFLIGPGDGRQRERQPAQPACATHGHPGVRRTSPEAEPRASPSPGRGARSLRSSALARPGASRTPPHPSPHLLRKTAVRPCGAASGGDPGPACPEPTPTKSPRQRHVHPLSTCGPLLSPSPRDTGPSPHRAVQRHAR